MDNTTNNNYDEISLRELILTIWNGKVIIALFTAVAVLIAAIYSYVILDNTYQASTTFRVSPIKVTNASTEADSSLYTDIDNKLALNVDNYASFFSSIDFLENLVEKVQLKDDEGNLLEAAQVAGKISTTADEAKGTIAVTVTDKDPERVYLIADALRAVLIDHVNEYAKNNINEYRASIDYNLDIARNELNNKREELNSFRDENGNIELLSDEVDRLKARINTLNSSLITLEADIDADISSLDAVVEQLREDGVTDIGTAEIISEIKQSAYNSTDAEIDQVGGELYLQTNLDMNNSQIANSVRMVELNRLQIRLLNNFNRQQTFIDQLTSIEEQFQQKQQDFLELNPRYTAVKGEYDIMAATYDAYVQRQTAAQSIDTLDIANPHVTQVVRPELPDGPSGPRRALNMAIALVLGLMLGVFVVFFREYWKNSAKQEQV